MIDVKKVEEKIQDNQQQLSKIKDLTEDEYDGLIDEWSKMADQFYDSYYNSMNDSTSSVPKNK